MRDDYYFVSLCGSVGIGRRARLRILLLNDVKPLELEPPMCEGETKREIKDNNEINQCLKEILNTCNSEDEEVDDKI